MTEATKKKTSEAQRNAAQKWDAANLDRMAFAAPYGTKDAIKAAAAAEGISVNKWIVQTVRKAAGMQDE